MDLLSLAKSKKYTEVYVGDTAEGLGSVKGAPCELISAVHDDENKCTIMTYKWTGNDGRVQTQDVRIPDGADGKDGELDVHFFEDRIEAISKADWESLTEAEAAGRNFLITDDEFNSNAFDIAYRDSDVGDALDELVEANTYSTEETIVGTWIDGKPIYRKVYATTIPSDAAITTATTIVDISADNIAEITNVRGIIKFGNEVWRPIPTAYYSGDIFSVWVNTKAVVAYFTSANYAGKEVKVILEYTKVID